MKRFLLAALGLVLCSFSHTGWSVLYADPEFGDFQFGSWNGQGSPLPLTRDSCVTSYFLLPRWMIPYYVTTRMVPAAGEFVLTGDGGYTVGFTLEIAEGAGAVWEPLTPEQVSTGLESGCPQLRLEPNATDLYRVPAGQYSTTIELDLTNNWNDFVHRDMTVSIQIPRLIQISEMDNISLGTYDGSPGPRTYTETFCVYTNAGDYSIQANSANGSSGTYALSGATGQLEYTVRASNAIDMVSPVTLTNGGVPAIFGADLSTLLDGNCDSGPNAAIQIEIPESELQAAPPGDYSGTLVLQVSPV